MRSKKDNHSSHYNARHFCQATGESESYIRAVGAEAGFQFPIQKNKAAALLWEVFRRRGYSTIRSGAGKNLAKTMELMKKYS